MMTASFSLECVLVMFIIYMYGDRQIDCATLIATAPSLRAGIFDAFPPIASG